MIVFNIFVVLLKNIFGVLFLEKNIMMKIVIKILILILIKVFKVVNVVKRIVKILIFSVGIKIFIFNFWDIFFMYFFEGKWFFFFVIFWRIVGIVIIKISML